MGRPSAVKTLGEVALRVNDLQQMKRFYEDVLGLEVLGEFPTAVLLKIEMKDHNWVKWRSLYFHDPEGNQVELVCDDDGLCA